MCVHSIHSGLAAGVYTTNSPEAVFHVLESSNANIVVVDDTKQMDKIKEIKHRLPNLKAAIQLYGPYEPYVKREDGYYRVCIESPRLRIFQNNWIFLFIFSGQKFKRWILVIWMESSKNDWRTFTQMIAVFWSIR